MLEQPNPRLTPERLAEIENRVAEIPGVAARSRPSGEGVAYELIAKGDGRTIAAMSSRSDWIAMHSALVHAPADLADLIAEVRALTAERDEARRVCDRPGCDAVVVRRDDGSRRCGAGHDSRWVERADFDALTARVAELEEAARWRHLPERPPKHTDVLVQLRSGAFIVAMWLGGTDYWDMTRDRDVLGWRPLGPGPDVAGG